MISQRPKTHFLVARLLGHLLHDPQEESFVGVRDKIDYLRSGNVNFNDQFLELPDRKKLILPTVAKKILASAKVPGHMPGRININSL